MENGWNFCVTPLLPAGLLIKINALGVSALEPLLYPYSPEQMYQLTLRPRPFSFLQVSEPNSLLGFFLFTLLYKEKCATYCINEV